MGPVSIFIYSGCIIISTCVCICISADLSRASSEWDPVPSTNIQSSSRSSNSNHSIQQQLSKAQQLKAARQPRQQGNSPSSPGGLMPPAAKAGCWESDQLSSYRGHRYLPQGISGCRPRAPKPPTCSRQPGNLGSKATAQAALGDSCAKAGCCESNQLSVSAATSDAT